ncbi:MAG TPA: site-2 protease family protein [Acidimicrobiales bacterium]|nr:site-2 protease family protein [Acidimicrobiales bacterium]
MTKNSGSQSSSAGSVQIGRIAGVSIRLHWTFGLLIALVAASAAGGSSSQVVDLSVWIAVVFACVVLHELAHSIVARRRGATVLGILLLPIGGMSQLDRLPDNPDDEFAIAIVGPLASFAIAGAAAIGAVAFGSSLWPPVLTAGSWLGRIMWLNILLGAFNMLPALPMDGGRVLRARLSRHRNRSAATRIASQIARTIAYVMLVVGFFFDFWLILIGIFVLLGARAEEVQANSDQSAEIVASNPK